MTKYTKTEIAEARENLAFLKPGDQLRTILRHVSKSGLTRHISVGVITANGYRDITYSAGVLLGYSFVNHGPNALVVGGVGMDMGFHVVYGLASRLFPNGHQCTGSTGVTPAGKRSSVPRCPSNDHSNDYGDLCRKFDAEHMPLNGSENPLSGDADQETRTAYVSARQAWIHMQKTYTKTRTHRDGGYALTQSWL